MLRSLKAGVLVQALAFLVFISSVPLLSGVLTETVYIVPSSLLDLNISAAIDNNLRIAEKLTLGFSPLNDLSIFFSINYIDHWNDEIPSGVGDFNLRFKYFLGTSGMFSSAFLADFNIPQGRDSYSSADHRNLSFGNNEFTAGYILRYDPLPEEALHLNINYTFREARGESLYGGFYLHPARTDTYRTLLGLNPFSGKAFLYYKKLSNDYVTGGISAASERLYPFVFLTEIQFFFRPFRGRISDDDLPVSGLGAEPVLFSVESRFFYDNNIFFSFYLVADLTGSDGYPGYIAGFSSGFLL